ncbi:MAG: stage V sporulation protein AC [Ruminococcaceae bacterium]|nr:stage V sporulation protein AC [Oscillospiraceae bacterium]
MSKRKFTEAEKQAFRKFAEAHAPKSNLPKDCLMSFIVGGIICTVGQAISDIYKYFGANEETAKTLTPITLVLISCILTGFGIYEKIAKKAGAGTLVPITGFANSVCSCAIDGKPEGLIKGVGTGMFAIAGPVIVYGISAGVIYGIIYYIVNVIF